MMSLNSSTTWTAISPRRLHFLTWGLAFGLTDIGPVRTSNEDNFLIDEALELIMVADGMGGHAAGAIASATALLAVRQFLQEVPLSSSPSEVKGAALSNRLLNGDPDDTGLNPNTYAVSLLNDAIKFSNSKLYIQNLEKGLIQGGMGTTLTGFWHCAFNKSLIFFHVGDSRLYRYRTGNLIQLTRDQTQYQQAIDMGAIENLPPRNILLQAMGPAPNLTPEICGLRVERNDLLMLCSDGLHGSVPHGEMEKVLGSATESTLEKICGRLIFLAKKYGGRDNITVLLVLCSGLCSTDEGT